MTRNFRESDDPEKPPRVRGPTDRLAGRPNIPSVALSKESPPAIWAHWLAVTWGLARKMTASHRSSLLPEDLAHSVTLDLWEMTLKAPVHSPRVFLATSMERLLLREARSRRVTARNIDSVSAVLAQHTPTPEEDFSKYEEYEILRTALEGLIERQHRGEGHLARMARRDRNELLVSDAATDPAASEALMASAGRMFEASMSLLHQITETVGRVQASLAVPLFGPPVTREHT